MRKILISIKPEYVNNIINGTKKFEYRTIAAKEDISSLVIYCTYPKKKVVAEASIMEVLKLSPLEMWNQTKDYSGISEEKFFLYFKNRKYAYAYKLGEIKIYDEPLKLIDLGISYPPQSFIYLN